MEEAVKQIISHINPIVIILILLGGEFAKRYLPGLNWAMAFKTLLVGTLFVALYIGALAIAVDFDRKQFPDAVLSYFVATSVYELALKYVIDFCKKKLGIQ